MNLYACKTLEAIIYVIAADIGEALAMGTLQAQKLRPAQPAAQREILAISKHAENVVMPKGGL